MHKLSLVFNGLLVGASGYAIYGLRLQYPYALTAAAVGMCHGILGLIRYASDRDNNNTATAHNVMTSIMEIVPLPLINIELFYQSQVNSGLALGHGLFIIPLAFQLITKYFSEDGDDESTSILVDLTVLGNIVSCLYLAVNENNYIIGAIAASVFLSKYGASAMDALFDGSLENTALLGNSLMYAFCTQALVGTFLFAKN